MSDPKTAGLRKGVLSLKDIEVPILDYVIPPITDGYIPNWHLDSGLEVVIPELWDGSAEEGEFNIVRVRWLRGGAEGRPPYVRRFDGPISEGIFPLKIPIARDYLETDGTVFLHYEIEDETTLISRSTPRILYLDRTPPNNNVKPLPPVFPVAIIDEDYLRAHATVDLTVAFYNGRRARDRIYYYVSDKTPPPDAAPDGYIEFPLETTPLIVPIPGDVFRLYPNGTQYVHIRLEDRSGNPGPRSDQASVEVDLLGSPTLLQPPVIPAMAGGLINRHEARLGVVARVNYTNWQPGDRVALRWGNTTIGLIEVTKVPFDVDVPWLALIDDGLGPAQEFAHYTIWREGSMVPTFPSPGTRILWDFTVAGQDHANAPQLINTDLPRVRIFGEGSTTDNHIDIRDKDKRIYASVALYHTPRDGELLELYWGNFPSLDSPVASYRIDTSNGDVEGARVEFSDIPWQVIVDAGNNDRLPVYYTTFNGVNEQIAYVTEVTVAVIAPLIFRQAEFPSWDHLTSTLNCSSIPPLWDHIPIRVAPDLAFRRDDVVILSWIGYTEIWGGGKPIPETAETITHSLTAEEAINGYTFKLDNYAEKIAPIKSPDPTSPASSAYAVYTVWRGTQFIGSSRLYYVKIDRRRAGGLYCGPDGNGPEL
ncbi:hypothetical protein AU074_30735 [Pseudomonas sp. ATCC PTA-122608]|uniref:hypothetical protein n=1 Tax=Pseudomonas sp. ATCC PTA-122608 TaxID=1771311 RepID=UPI00096B815B|nr:hypothetical protein [Pseudomonas sp. ATCC PTA-122608]OLY73319.1 hypothetical protein AU074_30735 [Pseudomonas sp. ATCC PTA-122608]